jgi:peptidoglycan pentaglycine glycine transferase (the first glycine)
MYESESAIADALPNNSTLTRTLVHSYTHTLSPVNVRQLTTRDELASYDRWITSHPEGNLWQSLDWRRYQDALGRDTRLYGAWEGQEIAASALVVIDRTKFGLATWDIPRGPLSAQSKSRFAAGLLDIIANDAKKSRGLSLYLSPPMPLNTLRCPLTASARHEQPPATRIIDLQQSEQEILAQMKPKGRYNIRVAKKHGVRVDESNDIEAFVALALETARRDGFTPPPASHYRAMLQALPGAFLLLAFPPEGAGGGGPIAGLLGVIWGRIGIYYYGASDYAYRALMGPYLLQWEAMRLCKARGCHSYDLLGIAPPSRCPPSPAGRGGQGGEDWAGISRFKEQFGGTVMTYPPELQLVLRVAASRLLQWKRRLIG